MVRSSRAGSGVAPGPAAGRGSGSALSADAVARPAHPVHSPGAGHPGHPGRTARLDAWRSIRRFCLECQGESSPAVRVCTDRQCALWPWRLPEAPSDTLAACLHSLTEADTTAGITAAETSEGGSASDGGGAEHRGEDAEGAPRDPRLRKMLVRCALRAIRRHCLNCAGDRREVRACAAREECVLWSLRFGVRPETYKAVRQRFFAPKRLTLF